MSVDGAADADFVARYFFTSPAEDLAGLSDAEKRGAAFGHREFASIRPAGVPKVRVLHRRRSRATRSSRSSPTTCRSSSIR